MAVTKVSLKLLIDRNANRVLFAEADKDFVDFLFWIFSLPIGTVVKLLTKDSMVGCLGKLYGSIERLNETYMLPNQSKDSVLNPRVQIQTDVAFLLPGVESSSTKRNLYGCLYRSSNCESYVADDASAVCPSCRNRMKRGSTYVGLRGATVSTSTGTNVFGLTSPFANVSMSTCATGSTSTGATVSTSTDGRGFVKGVVTYMVMDDLAVSPMSTISCITLLNKFGVKDVGALEEKVVELGKNEGLKILRESMQSTTVLTRVFLGKKCVDRTSRAGPWFSMAATKISLKLLIDRNANRVLLAEADKDFVDFLFHIFSLTIGTVVKLLTKDSMVGCLGKFYDSVERLNESYMQPNQSKDSVLNPKVQTDVAFLLPGVESSTERNLYGCSYGVRSLYGGCGQYVADDASVVCPSCQRKMDRDLKYVSPPGAIVSTSTDGRGFVKGVVMYMVMNDLAVSPMSTISSVTLLNKFSVKDVGALEEKVVKLGINEGLKILRESMQSTTVLTSVFLGKNGVDIPF